MAGLSMQNQMLNDMIARAERRAERQCPEGDPEHPAWVAVDELMTQQKGIMESMGKFTTKLVIEQEEPKKNNNESDLVDLVEAQPDG